MSEPLKLHPYQTRTVRFGLEHNGALILASPGAGKTACILAMIKILKAKGLVHKTLVLAPLRVVLDVWRQEGAKWTDFQGLTFAVSHGKNVEAALRSDVDVVVANYESIEAIIDNREKERTTSGFDDIDKPKGTRRKYYPMTPHAFKKTYGFDMLVCDEVNKLKNSQSVRFKKLKKYFKTFKRRYGLTGSPGANGCMDLFGICYVVDSGATLGEFITHYREEFFVSDFMGYDWELKPGADQEIFKRIAPIAIRIDAADYLTLPTLVEQNIEIDLPEKAMTIYRDMEKEFIARITSGEITAANAAAASSKCRQIVGGAVLHDPIPGSREPRKVEVIHKVKLDALSDLVDELRGEPLLVAYQYVHEVEMIRSVLGADTPYIGGGVGGPEGQKILEHWKTGKLPVLLVNPASAAWGLNLQGSMQHLCWFTQTWDLEQRQQMIARILRQGSTADRVFVYNIVARRTLDVWRILPAIEKKATLQQALFDAVKQLGGV